MKISHIITTFNRAEQLERSLKRLSTMTKADELIVLDDGGSDHTERIVKEAKEYLQIPIKYIYRSKQGYDVCSIPRNICVNIASGDYLVVSEPECLFISDIIGQFKKRLEKDKKYVITAGTVYFTNPETPIEKDGKFFNENPEEFINNIWDVKKFPMHKEDFEAEDGTRIEYTQATVTKGVNMTAPFVAIYKKEWIVDIGGWDEDMSLINGGGGYAFDDTDLLTRLRIKGLNQIIDQDIQCIHQWHTRPPGKIADGWKRNEEIMKAKGLEGNEYPTNPILVANQQREWGKIDGSLTIQEL